MQLTTSEGCVHAAPQGPGAGLEWAVASLVWGRVLAAPSQQAQD